MTVISHQQSLYLLYVGWNDRIVRLPYFLESALRSYDELLAEEGCEPVYREWSRHRIAAELYDLGLVGQRRNRLFGKLAQPWRGVGCTEEIFEVRALREQLRIDALGYVPTRFVVLLDEVQALARVWGGHGRLGLHGNEYDVPLQNARRALAAATRSGCD